MRASGNGFRGAAQAGLRYFLSACGGILTDWAVFSVAFWALQSPVPSQALARTAGAVVAFTLYRAYAFRAAGANARRQAARFVFAAAGSWILSVGMVAALSASAPTGLDVKLAGFLAKLAADGVSFVANYFVMRFFVFRPAALEGGGTA